MPPHNPPEGYTGTPCQISHVPSPTAFHAIRSPPFHLSLQNYAAPPQKKTRLPAPKPGRINFPKRHSAVSLGKLEEGWKRDKGKGMRLGKAAAESKDSLTYGQAMLSLGFFEGYSLHLSDF